MKKCCAAICVVLAIVVFAGFSYATPKLLDSIPVADKDGNITTPSLSADVVLENVEICNDVWGTKPHRIGPQHTFKLKPGQSFKLLWKDQSGAIWYQMLTPPPSLTIECSHPDGCKFRIK